ncbi:MAG: 50S ribosomal protein L29 [Candidatus Diapherotrites archaeon]
MPRKIDELRDLAGEELEARLVGLRADIAKERALAASGTRAEKPAKARNMRRMVARILTILKEKKMGINVKKKGGNTAAKAEQAKEKGK